MRRTQASSSIYGHEDKLTLGISGENCAQSEVAVDVTGEAKVANSEMNACALPSGDSMAS